MTGRATTVASLAAAIPGARLIGPELTTVTGIAYDSRIIEPGHLFAALRGADLDGHGYVSDAERRGAKALLVEEPVDLALSQIVVPDSRAALADLSAAFYDHPSSQCQAIGITGTDGKTTTSYIVDHLFRALGASTGMIGTVAIRIGDREDVHSSRQSTPESSDIQRYLRQMVDASVDWAILEATSHGLAMHRLDQVRFLIAAVTNITHEHLDFHGSVENYRRAKGILVERVAAVSGTVILNAGDSGARSLEPLARGARVLKFGINRADADVSALEVNSDAHGSRFVVDAGAFGRDSAWLPLIGEFNVANALCALSIALSAGFELHAITSAIAQTPAVPGRMSLVDLGQDFSIVVDYAHTPDSLSKVLGLLRRLHPAGRLIAVFGSAGERDVVKRPMQGSVAARQADVTIVTSEDPRFEDPDAIIADIVAGAEAAGAIRERTLYARTDRRQAIELAIAMAQPGDCVLLAGKGHEASIIWGREKLPWDEARVARELLADAGYSDSQL